VPDDQLLWRLRVDVFAPYEQAQANQEYQHAVRARVATESGQTEFPEVAFDGGTGAAGAPVIGTLFWVRAATAGAAADAGIRVVFDAYRDAFGAEAQLYDVTAIPRAAVVLPDEPHYPAMPD
jgi:hypothetical protein